jgi:MscS family membrane protein
MDPTGSDQEVNMMDNTRNLLDRINTLFNQVGSGNEPWRYFAALAVLILGFVLSEILFRYIRKRVLTNLEKRGFSLESWDISAILPPLRLASIALLLRMAESIIALPAQLTQLLRGLEGLLLALAAILILFQVISVIDRLLSKLPTQLQEGIHDATVSKVKSVMRISVLVIVAAAFVSAQRNLFPEWLWKYAWWRYLLAVVIINMIWLLIRLSEKLFSGILLDLKESEEKVRTRLVLQSTVWPIRLLLITIAVYVVREILPLPVSIEGFAGVGIGLLTTLAVVLFLYRMVDLVAYELTLIAQRPDNLMDQTFVQMVRVFSRILVILVGSIFLIRALTGKPMSTLLAGLGIGGLAVALAAQDTLKNLFGSIMIMLDKPFEVGQRIVLDGFDGVVEDIGFRSTRVRTLTGHQVTIPNGKTADSGIENIGRRPSIRRLTNITITYDTPPEKIERALAIIRGILENHEGMDPDFPPRAYFNEFNDASLNIMMIYWYHPADYWSFVSFSERVNLEIMRAFEAEGIEFAFPTTTTYLAHDDKRPLNIQLSGDSDFIGRRVPPSEQPPEIQGG